LFSTVWWLCFKKKYASDAPILKLPNMNFLPPHPMREMVKRR
jgi:hypothetical protein